MVKHEKKVVKSVTPSEAVQSTMVKKVNIIARIPVKTVTPELFGTYMGISMSAANICKCLTYRAIVEEVLPDGSLIKLDMTNYNKINSLEDPVVQQKILEHRQSAVLGQREQVFMTTDNIVNHTAPLPRNHFLYAVKESAEVEALQDPKISMEKEKEQLQALGEQSTRPPERNFPMVDTGSGEVHRDDSTSESEEVSEDDRQSADI